MLGAMLVAAFSVASLVTDAIAATMVTATIGTVVVSLLHRRQVLAVGLGAVAVAVSALWWGLHVPTGSGIPTLPALRTLLHSLQATRSALVGFQLPLVHTSATVALSALLMNLEGWKAVSDPDKK